jgi:class 3 adenylate cyclase
MPSSKKPPPVGSVTTSGSHSPGVLARGNVTITISGTQAAAPPPVERRQARPRTPRRPSLRDWAGASPATPAIVFTDIVNSTAMGNRLGDATMTTVREAHLARSDRLLNETGGRQVKTIGDSVMAVFRSVQAAFEYAYALHLDPGHPALRDEGVRAGIHIGSVEVTANDIFGSEVNFAARVLHAIAGAEIWLSSQALHDLKTRRAPYHNQLRWQDHPGIALKGFIGVHTLWSLAPPRGAGRTLAEIAPTPEPPPRPDPNAP